MTLGISFENINTTTDLIVFVFSGSCISDFQQTHVHGVICLALVPCSPRCMDRNTFTAVLAITTFSMFN